MFLLHLCSYNFKMNFMNKLWIILFSFTFLACTNGQNSSASLSAKEFHDKISELGNPVILDVRTPDEFNGGTIENAINADITSYDFTNVVQSLDKSQPVMVFCLSGGRSKDAAKALRNMGFNSRCTLGDQQHRPPAPAQHALRHRTEQRCRQPRARLVRQGDCHRPCARSLVFLPLRRARRHRFAGGPHPHAAAGACGEVPARGVLVLELRVRLVQRLWPRGGGQ